MTNTHSPLPWKLGEQATEWHDADGNIVMDSEGVFPSQPDEAYALHSANTLPELIATLQICERFLVSVMETDNFDEPVADGGMCVRHVIQNDSIRYLSKVRATLAKAKGAA